MSAPATILMMLKRVDCVDGVAAYLETLVKGLTARGDRVIMLSGPVSTPDGSATRRDALRAAVVDWVVIDDLQFNRPVPAQVRRILALIRQHGVTVLGPHGLAIMPFAWLIARLSGKGMVGNYHPSVWGDVARDLPVRRPFKQRVLYRTICTLFPATRFIAASKEVETFFRRDCGIPARRIHFQVFGIDSATYQPAADLERERIRAGLGIAPGTLVCVLSGRLALVKGHDIAVDAIRQLRRERPDLRLVCLFAGSGSQKEEIEAYAHHDDADRASFVFLGFINSAKRLREIYCAADILLLPSRFEGLPSVVSEAMCCGAVPIRSPSGGWQDQVIDGDNGFVVPFNDAPAVAARIVELSDPARLLEMRNRAIAFASKKFDKQVMIDGTSELYRAIASREIT